MCVRRFVTGAASARQRKGGWHSNECALRRLRQRAYCNAVIDLSKCPALERIPGKVSGVWLFRGTRLPLWVVLDNLRAGASLDDIADWFEIERGRLEEVLNFLALEAKNPLEARDHAFAG